MNPKLLKGGDVRRSEAELFWKITGKEIRRFLPQGFKKSELDLRLVEVEKVMLKIDISAFDFAHRKGVRQFIQKEHDFMHRFIYYQAICFDGSILDCPELEVWEEGHIESIKKVQTAGRSIGEAWADHMDKIRFVISYDRDMLDTAGNSYDEDSHTVNLFAIRNRDKARFEQVLSLSKKAGDNSGVLFQDRKNDIHHVIHVARLSRVKF